MKEFSAEKIHWIKHHIPQNREEYLEITKYSGSCPVAFPRTVYVEVGARCNLNCIFCSKPTRRKFDREMDQETIFRVIEECKNNGVYGLYLHLFNEPLAHLKKLLPVISKAKEAEIPIVAVTTNGTLLSKKVMVSLIEAGLDTLHFSYEGSDPEIYKEMRGGKTAVLDKIIRESVIVRSGYGKKKQNGQLIPWIAITHMRTKESDAQINSFIEKWRHVVDDIEIRPVLGFLGRTRLEKQYQLIPEMRIPCRYLGDRLIVAADGTVTGCSVDVDAELNLGNVMDGDTLQSIWNSKKYRDLWALHQWERWDELPPPCNKCESWDFLSTGRSTHLKKTMR